MIEMKNGSLFMPFDQVRLTATGLNDAYKKLRASMPELTANHHVSLAKWCVTHKQFAAAKTELLDALESEPGRTDARQMLARLDSLVNPQPKPVVTKKQPNRTDFHPGEFESLNGLSRSDGQHFVKRVLPILKNKCGNATCHGGKTDKNPFRLVRTGGRDHRIFAERDLAEVLKYIDTDSPGSSRLFAGMAAGHGGTSRTIFYGRTGLKQTDAIREWVYKIAADQKRDSSHRVSETPKKQKIVTASHTEVAESASPANRRTTESTPARQRILDSVREEVTPDAFDPDVFNRMNRVGRKRPTAPSKQRLPNH